jgi:hypothetical protein
MTVFTQRGPMQQLAPRIRAYFAPVDRATATPSLFDAAQSGQFALDTPPAPWLDAGWISDFRRAAATKIQPLTAGMKGAAQSQCRTGLSAAIDFNMHDWGKLQMAISSGSQHINLLAEDPAATPLPSGGIPALPIATLPGSNASEIVVGPGVPGAFALGDLVAIDLDYTGATGYVGSGVPGAYIKDPADVSFDPNYLRRITFNVGRVSGKTTGTIQLAQPLIGGAPPAGAQVQKVIGFVDREGGSFFQEWSGLFVCGSETGARTFYYYPRLQSAAPSQESSATVASAFDGWSLHANLIALPTTDSLDHEQVLCYRSFVPAPSAALY